MNRIGRLLLVCALGMSCAGTSSAAGVASLNWDSCIGPISKTVLPGTAPSLYVSVLGHSAPHKAYDVRVQLYSQGHALADAWRFDAEGCQGTARIAIDHVPGGGGLPSCPAFMQSSAPSLQIKTFTYDPLTGRARVLLANAYPNGVASANPVTRYFLARFTFDQAVGVNGASNPGNTCGGLEVPVCFLALNASWLSLDGIETVWPLSSEFVAANTPEAGYCLGTPARATTWGSLKSQYRN